jgi:hypothetical protein
VDRSFLLSKKGKNVILCKKGVMNVVKNIVAFLKKALFISKKKSKRKPRAFFDF